MKVRVRIAPSPTGLFHLGSLRTALTNYLFARKEHGVFVVRIEDTDQARLVPAAIPDMLESLRWVGIEIDEGVTSIQSSKFKAYLAIRGVQSFQNRTSNKDTKKLYNAIKENVVQKGNFGPYIKSERRDIYRRYAEELLRKKMAYPCFCSPERLEKTRQEYLKKGLPPKYDRLCLQLSEAEAKKKMSREPYVIRVKIPSVGKTTFNDLVRGKIEIENKLLDDPVIIKSDGFPTYHFAVVVDDHLMRISHIFRGEEWISSTAKHVLIYKAFGWEVPQIGHLTNILNMRGGKLSKRDGDVSVSDFRRKGFLPEAIINFVALLGWNPKNTREIFSLPELIKEFDVKKLNKAAPRFDQRRLEWFGGHYMRQKPASELAKLITPYLGKYKVDKNTLDKIAVVQQPRMRYLEEVTQDIEFLFRQPQFLKVLLHWKDMTDRDTVVSLRKALAVLEKIPPQKFTLGNLEKFLMKAAGVEKGPFLWPLRVALTGQQKSPSPFECAWMLGKEETLKRVSRAIVLLG